MKFIKLDDPVIDEILLHKLDHIGIINDEDAITINDEIEFFNNSNVVFGQAKVKKITVQRLSEFDLSASDYNLHLNITGETNQSTSDSLKIVHFSFEPYAKPHKLATNTDLNVTEIKIYADGGSRGNPGPSASGWPARWPAPRRSCRCTSTTCFRAPRSPRRAAPPPGSSSP